MLTSARLSQDCAKEEIASTPWARTSASARLAIGRARDLRSVKVSKSQAAILAQPVQKSHVDFHTRNHM